MFENGSYYEGSFKFDKKDGQGKYVWADGSNYNGQWVGNNMSGFGRYVSSTYTYEGTYNIDKMWGNGIYTANDGSYYQGQFLNGYLHGQGTCYSPGKNAGPCVFKDGKNVTEGKSFIGNFLGNIIKSAIIGEILN